MSRIGRRDFLKGAIAGGAAMAAAGRSRAADAAGVRRPNVLVIIDDQHNKRAMGWTGQTEAITPCLDRLAGQSAVFTDAYTNSPICAPMRHCLYSGLYVAEHGVFMNEHPMRPDVPTMMSRLNAAGYTTANIGKMHNTPCHARRDFQFVLNHEFYIDAGGVSHYVPWAEAESARRGLPMPRRNWAKPRPGYKSWATDPNCIVFTGWLEEDLTPEYWITEQSLAFIADQMKNRPDKPFFLHASYFPPHHPYGPIKKYLDLYDPARLKLPPNFSREDMDRWCRGDGSPDHMSDDEVRRWRAHYFGFVSQLDAQIGRLLDGLDKLGAADNTIVIFTSDHGDQIAEHGRFYKDTMYEGSAGVPLMIRWPGVAKARRVGSCVSHVDLVATILAAAGLDGHRELPGLRGADLRPLLAGRAWTERPVFSEIHHRMPFSQLMWRRGPYKLIEMPGGRGGRSAYQLFNIDEDPWEMKDLAGEAGHAAILKRMAEELRAAWGPLAELLPEKLPPPAKRARYETTWPTDPWRPVLPVDSPADS